jgi:hypothetical protein
VARSHLLEQSVRLVLVHDINTVADSLGMAKIDGFADVETKAVGRNETWGQFAGVE